MQKTPLLFLIILIEGYVVLACELLAIRQLTPFIGSGIETVSIIISGILLPLATGYNAGGGAFEKHYANATKRGKKPPTIRKILLKNILSALVVLTLGLSYPFLEMFFFVLHHLGIDNRLLQAACYTLIFLVAPVFLLAQTVPLVSNYFSRRKLSEITGKMLFFSTTGSFLGSVFSTIVLMTTIGVHNTVIVTLGLLCALGLIITGRKLRYETVLCPLLLGIVYLLNNNTIMQAFHVVSNDPYNMISVLKVPGEDSLILAVNRSGSSKWSSDPKNRFTYVTYIEKNFIEPISAKGSTPRDILIIGAGGFTMGLNDTVNHYTFVDIDPTLKTVVEKYFLPEKLTPNKQFIASSARAFVHSSSKKYDLVILDVYTNMMSIPMECVTQEFLRDVRAMLKDQGIVVANIIASPIFSDKFSVRYDHTFASVFPAHTRQVIGDFAPSAKNQNILYIFFNNAFTSDNTIYTDDKNTYSLDRK